MTLNVHAIVDQPLSQEEAPHNQEGGANWRACWTPKRFPIFIVATSICQVLTFFGYYLIEKAPVDIMTFCPGCSSWPDHNIKVGLLDFVPERSYELWRWFSYQFCHNGLYHLYGNVEVQLAFGIALELEFRSRSVALINNAAIVTAPLFWQHQKGLRGSIVGASEGAHALVVAYLVNCFLKRREIKFTWWRIAVIGYCLCGCVADYTISEEQPHIAGGVIGLISIFIINMSWRGARAYE